MKFKHAIRCAILIILIKTIFSENVVFSTKSKFNTLDRTENLEAKNKFETDHAFNSSSLNETTFVFNPIIVSDFRPPDKHKNKLCADKLVPDSIVPKKLLKDSGDKFQSKLSWTGDILFGSLLIIFSKFLMHNLLKLIKHI